MNRSVVLGLGILLMAVVIGCSSKSEEDQVLEQMLANQKKMMELSKQNTEEAKAEVQKLQDQMKELEKKVDAWPKEKKEAFMKKMFEKMLGEAFKK
jgi:peptidoglycan hydrolase CwlO-like protein